jgi:iron complex outermembrane receptor protein
MPQVFACDPTRAYGAAACAQIARNTKNDFYAVESSLPDAGFQSDTWQIINTTTWHATDFLTVKNIASYGQYEDTIRVPLFGEDFLSSSALPAGLANRSYTFATSFSPEAFSSNDQKSWTEELQFQGRSGDSRLVWQAGGYIERSEPVSPSGNFSYSNLNCADPANVQCQNVLGAARLLAQPGSSTAATLTGSLNRSVGTMAFHNWAAYAQASYDVTTKVVLTGGIRYTSDTTRGTAQRYALYYDPQLPAALNSGNPIAALCTVGPLDTTATAARLNSLDACRISLEQNSDAPTWTIGVDYKPVEDLMLYTKYSRGYRQGSVNPFGPLGFNRFAEEEVDAYEAGMKFTFSGVHPGTFNIAGLYNDLSDQQLLIATIGGPGGATPGVVNAGKSRIWGTELESSIELFTNFRLDLSYAYLNTELVQAVLPTLPSGSLFSSITRSFDIGESLPLTPDHKLSLAGRYALPLPGRVGTVSVGAIYSYTSPYSTSSISSSGKKFYRVDETSLVTMNLNWESIAGSTFDASLFATNLLDEEHTPYVQAGINSLGFQSRVLGQPRMYGMRVRFRFGE